MISNPITDETIGQYKYRPDAIVQPEGNLGAQMATLFGIDRVSTAIRIMIYGLHKMTAREDFTVKMSTFGETSSEMCYGCAATCALGVMFQKPLALDDADVVPSDKWWNERLTSSVHARRRTQKRAICRFEAWCDSVRRGGYMANDLRDFMGDCSDQALMVLSSFVAIPTLNDYDWKRDSLVFLDLADKLEAVGY